MKNILFVFVVFIFSFRLMCSESDLAMYNMSQLCAAAEDNNEDSFKRLLIAQNLEQKKQSITFINKMSGVTVDTRYENEDAVNVILESHINNSDAIEKCMGLYRFEITNKDVSHKISEALLSYNGNNSYYDTIQNFAYVKRVFIADNKGDFGWRSLLSLAVVHNNEYSLNLLLLSSKGKAKDYVQEDEIHYSPNLLYKTKSFFCFPSMINLLFKHELFSLVQRFYLQGLMYTHSQDSNVLVTILKNGKIDINAPMSNGMTPLLHALSKRNVKMALYLLKLENIDTTSSDQDGNTPLHLAVKMLFYPIFSAGDALQTEPCKEVCVDDLSVLKELLKKKELVIIKNKQGNTPIHELLLLATQKPQTPEGKAHFKKTHEYNKRVMLVNLLCAELTSPNIGIRNDDGKSIQELWSKFNAQHVSIISKMKSKEPEQSDNNSKEEGWLYKDAKKKEKVDSSAKRTSLNSTVSGTLYTLVFCTGVMGLGFFLYHYLINKTLHYNNAHFSSL